MITEDDVRRTALALPGVYEQSSFGGRPSWRTKPRMFAWVRDAPEALVVWVASLEEKDELLAADPETFFTSAHYDGSPVVLVRMDLVDPDEAAELITESWRVRAPRSLTRTYDG